MIDGVSPEAMALHSRILVIDGLAVGASVERTLDNLRAGGVHSGNWTVSARDDNHMDALMKIEERHWLLDKFPEKGVLATSVADIERARREGRFACVLGFQSATPLENNFHLLSVFWRLGLRILQFTYNNRTLLADGCLEPENRGLTHYGIEIVRDCNRLGILLDVAHAGHRSAMDIVEYSRDPVHDSHAGAHALRPNPRNARDELIQAIAAKGGVVCVPCFSDFVGDTSDGRWPTMEDYMRHMDYVVNLVGADHVAIGSDLLEVAAGPRWDNNTFRRSPEICGGMAIERHHIKDMPNHSTYPRFTEAMLRHGYPEADIEKIMGLNLMRLYRRVWRG